MTLLATNIFESGARTPFGAWAPWYSWNAKITYVVPTSGVYTVEAVSFIEGPTPMLLTNEHGIITTNGWYNECWQEMNTSFGASSNCYKGFYTNAYPSTNVIRFPIRPLSHQFFRIKRKYDL